MFIVDIDSIRDLSRIKWEVIECGVIDRAARMLVSPQAQAKVRSYGKLPAQMRHLRESLASLLNEALPGQELDRAVKAKPSCYVFLAATLFSTRTVPKLQKED
ncbi:hypothetical protein [Massilia sp. DWR3-1-1]|uniref:hypothetical protein n=1 Tax=Massilia sp. DWR3-1-1 TaxID=2804559 RepID=UPI003CF9DB1B